MQYFKDKTGSTGVLFPEEIHCDSKVKQKWKEDINCPVLFSRKSISCGFLIAYFGTGTFLIKNNKQIKKVLF